MHGVPSNLANRAAFRCVQDGRVYFYHSVTKKTAWQLPDPLRDLHDKQKRGEVRTSVRANMHMHTYTRALNETPIQ
jgi:hypothetical protein